MRRAIRILGALLLMLLLAAAGLACWLLESGNQEGDVASWTVPAFRSRPAGPAVRISPLLRLATSAAGMRALDGSSMRTPYGQVAFARQGAHLVVHCAPCTLRHARLAPQPLQFSRLSIAIARHEERVSGRIWIAAGGAERQVSFAGDLAERGMALHWTLEQSSIAELLQLFGAAVPEAQIARVHGTLAAHGTLQLPSATWSVVPQLEGFEVAGLGTERLRHGRFAYGCRSSAGERHMRSAGEGTQDWITLPRMGRWLPRAVLATEDAHFYRHAGYDLGELLPLLENPQRSGRRGASTLTQQLAKNFFTGADASLARKVRELLYAVEMERTLGKQRILTLYLNTVDWGPGICGVADASQHYFGEAPRRLSASQAAWLAGILRNPHHAYRQEYQAGKVARERLDWVAAQMRLPAPVARRFTAPVFRGGGKPDAINAASATITDGAARIVRRQEPAS